MKQRKKNCFNFLTMMGFILIITAGCENNDNNANDPTPPKTEQVPVLTTTEVSTITQIAATIGGEIISDGGSTITARGICWNTSTAPTTSNYKTINGNGLGSFMGTLSGLTANTKYYVRAYATNDKGTTYGNELNFTTSISPTIAIGQTYEGGIIFYIDDSGQHGLVAAPSDQGTVNWGCDGTSIAGTSTALGTGLANTIAIVNKCSTSGIAARICYDLVLNGKSDWYLPSKDELNLLHKNLYLQKIGNFKMNRYWSSSQFNADFAWCQFFNLNLNQLYYDKDLIAYPIRAIRSF
jgi:hypothetical protein